MRWGNRRSLVACAGLAVVVAAAYATGRARLDGPIVFGSLAAAGLAVAAIFRPPSAGRLAGVSLLTWVVLAAATDQFAWAADGGGVFIAAAWLVPPVVGGAVLPTARLW